jgi:WD40 repeat protein
MARLGSTAFLGERPARSLTVSRDGRLVATANDDAVYVWNSETGNLFRRFAGPNSLLTRLAFTPDGRTLLTAPLGGGEVAFWDIAKGRRVGQTALAHQRLTAFGLSATGRRLATGTYDGHIILWEAPNGKKSTSFRSRRAQGPVVAVALSPDARRLVAVYGDDLLSVWDTQTRKVIFENGGGQNRNAPLRFSTLAFLPDGKTLAEVSTGSIRFWDTDRWSIRGSVINLPDTSRVTTELAFSSDGKALGIRAGENSLYLLRERGIKPEWEVSERAGPVTGFSFFPGGKKLAILTPDFLVAFLHTGNGKQMPRRDWRPLPVRALVFSQQGESLVSTGQDGELVVWDVKTKRVRRRIDIDITARALALAPDGKALAAAGLGVGVRVFAFPSGKLLAPKAGTAPLNPNSGSTEHLTFSPDGKQLASGLRDGRVYLWDATDGRQKDDVRRYRWPGVKLLAFTQDGKTLLSGAGSRIHEDDLQSHRLVEAWSVPEMACAARSADGKHLAVVTTILPALLLLDANSGKQSAFFDTSGMSEQFGALAFSRDGRWLTAGSKRGGVWVWEVKTGKRVRAFIGHADEVNALAFAPDGRMLASGSNDATVLLWDLTDLPKQAVAGK